jgi:hypothetical protein
MMTFPIPFGCNPQILRFFLLLGNKACHISLLCSSICLDKHCNASQLAHRFGSLLTEFNCTLLASNRGTPRS